METFIKENLERDIKNFELTEGLYKRYLAYCEINNLKPLGRKGFSARLHKERIGARYISNGKPARWGVKLLPCKY
ncbi:hypothetical protein J1P26_17335 [Neobacillus sp. MM2021_6]|nr:hypothetical protein [Neobacillus sp. MM2021_6]NHC19576.1 hypothetical protein [Bacillus sp. MM2020_4]